MEQEKEQEQIRQVMTLLGKRTSEKKKLTSAANGAKNLITDEKRAKLREAQQRRRARERQEQEAIHKGERPHA